MRSILRLIRLEAGFLKWTLLLIGVILTIFTAAFLSVVSVLIDVPVGMYEYLDHTIEDITSDVPVTTLAAAKALGGDNVYGGRKGLTYSTQITLGEKRFTVSSITWSPNGARTHQIGWALPESGLWTLGAWKSGLQANSRFPEKAGECCIDTRIASALGAKLGDELSFGGQKFTVTGFYSLSRTICHYVDEPGNGLFYLAVCDEEPMDLCCIDFNSSRDFRTWYDQMAKEGRDCSMPPVLSMRFGHIDLAVSFYTAIALLLAAIVFFVLWALFALFYRQRKLQICRLKMLGAKNATVAGLYCAIACLIVVLAVGAGLGFSFLFNTYYLSACAAFFETPFTSHFHPLIPVAVFFGFAAVVLLLYASLAKRIGNTRLAEEVRHE